MTTTTESTDLIHSAESTLMVIAARILEQQGPASFAAVLATNGELPVDRRTDASTIPGTQTLLVVENEELLLRLLQAYLTGQGYEVVTAHDGWEALARFRERKDDINLVFSDLELPGLDGLSLFQEIRSLSPRMRGVCSMGYNDTALAARAHGAGIDAVLSKPYNWKEMLKTLQTVLKL